MNKRAVIILLAVTLTTKVDAEDTVDLVGPLTSGKSGKSSGESSNSNNMSLPVEEEVDGTSFKYGKSSKSNNMSLPVEEDIEVEGKSFKYGKSSKSNNMSLLVEEDVEVEGKSFKYGKSIKSNNMSLLVEEEVEVEGKSFKYGKSIKASNESSGAFSKATKVTKVMSMHAADETDEIKPENTVGSVDIASKGDKESEGYEDVSENVFDADGSDEVNSEDVSENTASGDAEEDKVGRTEEGAPQDLIDRLSNLDDEDGIEDLVGDSEEAGSGGMLGVAGIGTLNSSGVVVGSLGVALACVIGSMFLL